nr:aminoglycoside phosphotransferase family protein [Paenibacillus rhizosphaerae]
MSEIQAETLAQVLSQMHGTKIICADIQTTPLHGGTVGNVQLVTGKATTTDGGEITYRIVLKTQKKWDRYSDPDSWRREYDLYNSNFGALFSETFRWPECYHVEKNEEENETRIWMEYINGISGLNLTGDMYERAAKELGRFQGKLYAEQPAFLQNLTNLSKVENMKNFYLHYRSWNRVYDYIRSDVCEIPKHLCNMLIDIDENTDEIFNRIEKLPIVLCHRDFWVTNLFYSDDNIILIDWDTTGWGYLGEDMASLIADEADIEHMVEYYRRCIPAYYKGFSEHADISHITDNCIYELILLMFGYRLVEWFMNAGSGDDERTLHLHTLQKIYEMRHENESALSAGAERMNRAPC